MLSVLGIAVRKMHPHNDVLKRRENKLKIMEKVYSIMEEIKMDGISNLMKKREHINIHSMVIYIGVLLIFAVMALICRTQGINFVTGSNIANIIVQSTIIAVIAIGQSIVIITGGIDLSVGSVAGFASVLTGILIKAGFPIWVAVIIGLISGGVMGLVNGLGVTYGKIPAFIMTLGMLSIARGGAFALNEGKPVANFPQELNNIANSTILGIPSFIIYVIVLYVIMSFVMGKTKYGRNVYAVGGNEHAAKLSGVSVSRVQIITYCLGGLFAALGGVFLLSRLMYGSPNGGSGYELQVIAAAIIGGIALSGGQGKLVNTFVGAIILSTLNAGLQMLNVAFYIQQMVTGIVIILAVFFDKAEERRAE